MIFVSFSSKYAKAVKDNLAIRKLTIKFATAEESVYIFFQKALIVSLLSKVANFSKSIGYNPNAHAECIFISIFLEQDSAQA